MYTKEKTVAAVDYTKVKAQNIKQSHQEGTLTQDAKNYTYETGAYIGELGENLGNAVS